MRSSCFAQPKVLSLCIAAILLTGCLDNDNGATTQVKPFVGATPNLPAEYDITYQADWPTIQSSMSTDDNATRAASIESRVAEILAQMSLEEKVGQMIQPDLREITPQELKKYHIGSILNGGGGWPDGNKYATAEDWAKEADKFWLANKEQWATRGFHIPFVWATDAVHGHNNVFKATVFPHNIGLGAARDLDLIKRIGAATAQEIAATGLDWTFAPTVATPRDDRWGRVYEGYSEDPQIVHAYAKEMVEGLQGITPAELASDQKVISNVKHWVGDGGTKDGVDRGENHYTEEYLTNIHAAGYLSGLNAGAQAVMTSFNSWWNDKNVLPNDADYNKKLHGSQYMVTDVLKNKMGFDGIVVTDWNGHSEINGCSMGNCAPVVNAGNDVLMVTANADWKSMYNNIIAQVESGEIEMARIDDAVTRILRVKMRAGLWDKPQPSARGLAGHQEILGSAKHRALAREAVSKSLVLFKNGDNILPLKKDQKIVLAGSAVDSIQKQTGGWSLTWQGDGNTIDKDFPGATTMKMAVESVVGADNIVDASSAEPDTVAIVMIGEDPYAEMMGDIKGHQTQEFSSIKKSYAADLETVKALKERGLKVVTVFYSGRPLYVNEEINNSDAFVAAWLPGTEAGGITDVLFGDKDFQGRLSYSWPMMKCSTSINAVTNSLADNWVLPKTEQSIVGEHQPLFPFGYGLSYKTSSEEKARIANLDKIPLDPRDYGCGMAAPSTGVATMNLEVFGRSADAKAFVPRISGAATSWSPFEVTINEGASIKGLDAKRINKDHQQDAVTLTFDGASPSQFYVQTADEKGEDRQDYFNADATLQFDVDMDTAAAPKMKLAMHSVHPSITEVDIAYVLPKATPDTTEWSTIKIPLECFDNGNLNFGNLNTPFLLFSEQAVAMSIANVRLVPHSVDAAEDAVSCDQLQAPLLPELDEAVSDIFGTTWQAAPTTEFYSTGAAVPEGYQPFEITANTEGNSYKVAYNAKAQQDFKALLHFKGTTQNLKQYVANGALQFELKVDSYGTPLEGQTANTNGMSIKINSEGGGSNVDYILSPANYPADGQWHPVSVPVSSLINDQIDITKVNEPLIIFPEWGASQAGVIFEVRSIKLKLNCPI